MSLSVPPVFPTMFVKPLLILRRSAMTRNQRRKSSSLIDVNESYDPLDDDDVSPFASGDDVDSDEDVDDDAGFYDVRTDQALVFGQPVPERQQPPTTAESSTTTAVGMATDAPVTIDASANTANRSSIVRGEGSMPTRVRSSDMRIGAAYAEEDVRKMFDLYIFDPALRRVNDEYPNRLCASAKEMVKPSAMPGWKKKVKNRERGQDENVLQMFTPSPDLLIAFPKDFFNGEVFEEDEMARGACQDEKTYYARYVSEYKSAGVGSPTSLWVSDNQCIAALFMCSHLAGGLEDRVGQYFKLDDLKDPINSVAFGLSTNGSEARLWVSWRVAGVDGGEAAFYAYLFRTFLIQRREEYTKLRRFLLNIVDWMSDRVDPMFNALKKMEKVITLQERGKVADSDLPLTAERFADLTKKPPRSVSSKSNGDRSKRARLDDSRSKKGKSKGSSGGN
ncbi:hypothetical protein F4818DRAFT_376962 [Hypoxylon cercidicola]|nr:hypothetical protein F4818DRAFT_376962 [Hypoxylon cercidicola]